jgi:hypothetical protein
MKGWKCMQGRQPGGTLVYAQLFCSPHPFLGLTPHTYVKEKEQLLNAVFHLYPYQSSYEAVDWMEVRSHLDQLGLLLGRTQKSIAQQFMNFLDPRLDTSPFTKAEWQVILRERSTNQPQGSHVLKEILLNMFAICSLA